jgi:cation diffusion facilitator family transporter
LAKSNDLNLRSAYVHILADAATSILAIFSLAMGWFYGVDWLDPVVGILGAALIAIWSKNLIADSALILLDCELKHPKLEQIRNALSPKSTGKVLQVVDLHVWRVGKNSFTCAVAIVTSDLSLTPEYVRAQLLEVGGVAHSTIEVNYV